MLQELLFIFLLAVIPTAISFFLDYCLGKPMSSEPNARAIFSIYSYSLALNRVKREGKLNGLLLAFKDQLNSDNPEVRREGQQQFKASVMLMAQKFYTWEQPLGVCIICTNFWVSVLSSLVMFYTIPLTYFVPGSFFLIIPIISHLILRKI